MKNLILLLLILPFSGLAQQSYFAEFSLDPFKHTRDDQVQAEQQTVLKDLNLGTSFDVMNHVTLNIGYSRLDRRDVSSNPFFSDFFIPGSIPVFQNLTLIHSPEILSHSLFSGLSIGWTRFRMEANLGYALGVFKDEVITAREFTTSTNIVAEEFFDIDYENISFFTGEMKLAYDILSSVDGSLAIVVKYKQDFSENREIVVKEIDPAVRQMVEDFPGSTFFDIDTFLEGGPLFYDRDFLGIGLRLRYNL